MIQRRWTPDPAGLRELWEHEAPRTRGAFEHFTDDDLVFRFRGGGRSVGELAAHVVTSYRRTRYWLTDGNGNREVDSPDGYSTVSHAVSDLSRAQRELFERLSELEPEDFDVVIAPFGVAEPRSVMALGMLKHEIHHRGELYAMARACGRPVVSLYASMES